MTKTNPLTTTWWRSLWSECDKFYAHDPKLYIQLQDRHQINVNLLLLSQWLDAHHFQLPPELWSQLHAAIQAHDEQVLIPYRQHRRACKKTVSQTVYQQMLTKELLLERKTQQYILQQMKPFPLKLAPAVLKKTRLKQAVKQKQTAVHVTKHQVLNLNDYLSLFDLQATDYPTLMRLT
ncbi:DUF2390 domain-containing protein [Shewanella surugensis]|uniref:DUF2390 domain-containing protein n=1 Tax=Shewanella surugensis TaxID=212020 RepID=A0ABT0LFN4_9GAMM|nr:DUF2390 domain-containing protein [Shewanella surugensis]MCL1126160.1 DUF2390 domain-containing protein [Shewanella surugensis]